MPSPQFRALAHQFADWIADYWERCETLPVRSAAAPGSIRAALPQQPPRVGVENTWDAIFTDLEHIILPGITHWQSPNFFAYFPANASGPAVLGELLAAGLGVQGMLWATSPACTELEEVVLDWLVDALGLPRGWRHDVGPGGGCLQGTASESALVAMVAARQRARAQGWDGRAPLTIYTSTHAHSSIAKSALAAGIARSTIDAERVRMVPVDAACAMDVAAMARTMDADRATGAWPLMVSATLGTTGVTAFDDIEAVAAALASAPASSTPWLHIDAAHAGAACICPEFRWMLKGIEHADSFCFNPHKWLLTNFDCDCFWVRDKRQLVQALSLTPEYLRTAATDAGAVTDLRDMQIPLGRRFRALKLWFVLRHYGIEGLRAHIREHVRLAELFESWVRADRRFVLAAPRRLNLVCFYLAGADPDGRTRTLLEAVNATGCAFLSHTVLERPGAPSRYTIRMAIGATQTREEHVRAAWELIQGLA